MIMRTDEQVLTQLLTYAQSNPDIRAVLLNGSRVNPNVPRDPFSDYDVIFAVTDPQRFLHNQDWIKQFGDLIIMQQNTLDHLDEPFYIFLMLFQDGVRIDLSFRNAAHIRTYLDDSLTKVLLDKDNVIPPLDPPSDRSYITRKPTQTEYDETINEIWWCSTNVAKGLWRQELPYAKFMLDVVVREALVKLLSWHVGTNNGWSVNTGKAGRWLQHFLSKDIWNSYVNTFAGSDYDKIWEALFETGNLTRNTGTEIAQKLGYAYPMEDDEKVTQYLTKIRYSTPKYKVR